jgi:hypothetical protein
VREHLQVGGEAVHPLHVSHLETNSRRNHPSIISSEGDGEYKKDR